MNLKQLFSNIASGIANRGMVKVKRETLAQIVSPLMAFKGDEYSETNKALLENYDDLADWVRIGYHHEKDKGTLYRDLQIAFTSLKVAINKADENSDVILIERECMDFIKEGACQISGAALGLESSAKQQNYNQVVHDKHGNALILPIIQPYNRPKESHLMAAYKLKEIAQNFNNYFAKKPIKATDLNLTL